MRAVIDFDTLKKELHYNPDTGIFTRLKSSGGVKAGSIAGYLLQTGYWFISIFNERYLAHRLAFLYMTGKWPNNNVDHINGNRSDNRWINLRDATQSINSQNLKKANSANLIGLLGVSRNKKRFMSRIKLNGRVHHIGTFDTPEEAHEEYLKMKRKLHEGNTL